MVDRWDGDFQIQIIYWPSIHSCIEIFSEILSETDCPRTDGNN